MFHFIAVVVIALFLVQNLSLKMMGKDDCNNTAGRARYPPPFSTDVSTQSPFIHVQGGKQLPESEISY